MRKIGLSIAAISLFATAAFAGDLNVTIPGEPGKIANELIAQKDVTVDLTASVYYTPTKIPAGSLSNPTLDLYVDGANIENPNENLYVCEVNASDKTQVLDVVLSYDHLDSANNAIIFRPVNSDKTMGNSKVYALCDENNNTTNLLFTTATIKQGTTNVNDLKIRAILYSGDSQEPNDDANSTTVFYTTANQLCMGIISGASAQIDPSTGFVAFGTSGVTTTGDFCDGTETTTDLNKQDLIQVGLRDKKSDFTYPINDYHAFINLKFENTAGNKIPLAGVTFDSSDDTYAPTGIHYYNESGVLADFHVENLPASEDIEGNLTLTVNGEDAIPATKFVATLGVDVDYDNVIDIDKKENVDAGQWTYQGKTVEIPYVVSSGDTQTAIRLSNNGGVNATVYWTCTDDNGVTVPNFEVRSADQNSTQIPANGAAAWLSSDILAAAQTINPDFAPNGKMKCSPLVTTTAADGVVVMTINGQRDRVIPVTVK